MKKIKRSGKDKMAFGLANRTKIKNENEEQHHFGGMRKAALIPISTYIGLRLVKK